MDWTEALQRLSNPERWTEAELRAAEQVLAAAVRQYCMTDITELEDWIADAAGSWGGHERPEGIALEYDDSRWGLDGSE